MVWEVNLLLAERLREQIKRLGPITFRDWMAAALYDESEGYYCRDDHVRWGRAGDYRTSPERSPLFAATFARYFAGLYQELGAPSEWSIFEVGAGGGHFANGVLDSLKRWHPQVFEATRYLIDEKSPHARGHVREMLQSYEDRIVFQTLEEMNWSVDPGLIFSNELLDAMPVHRVIIRDGKLLELCVDLNNDQEFIWTKREPSNSRLIAYFDAIGVSLQEGQIAEVNLAAMDWLSRAAERIRRGYLISVDYGAEAIDLYESSQRKKGTLRAIHGHRFAENVLGNPGDQDITATVDWTTIKEAGEKSGLETVVFERQDHFLLRAGLLDQLEIMAAASGHNADRVILRSSAREMILPGGMSESFQVLVQKPKNELTHDASPAT